MPLKPLICDYAGETLKLYLCQTCPLTRLEERVIDVAGHNEAKNQ